MLIGDVALLVDDLLDDVRLAQIAAVDAGSLRRKQRDGGDVEVLPEGITLAYDNLKIEI